MLLKAPARRRSPTAPWGLPIGVVLTRDRVRVGLSAGSGQRRRRLTVGAPAAPLTYRSPYNVVAVDLPRGEPDPYAIASEIFADWQSQGRSCATRSRPCGRTPRSIRGPDGRADTRGFFCRVRVEEYGPGRVRPHERTHPGPKEDRLRLTRATRANIVADLLPLLGPRHAAWEALRPALETPWGEAKDPEGTVHRVWRCRATRRRSRL